MRESEVITYRNEGFIPSNEVVGWTQIGTCSRPITRVVVGRVPRGVEMQPDGSERIRVNTYVRSYKGDYPLSLLGGSISKETHSYTETEISEALTRKYAETLTYSEFPADPAILFPGVERYINASLQQLVAV